LAALKPILSALVLPPAGPLLLAFVGLVLLAASAHRKKGIALVAAGLALSWLVGCHATAQFLSQRLLQNYPAVLPAQIVQSKQQAIVVLGSGMQAYAPEYGHIAQLSRWSAVRLRYGAWLSSQTQLPIAFSGGRGWSTNASVKSTEADAAQFYLASMQLPSAKWLEGSSSDTEQNAVQTARLLAPSNIKKIVLVTHAWHMERAVKLFTVQGFEILPAPVQPIGKEYFHVLNLIPTAEGLEDTRHVLREALGLLVLRLKN
jgi:uncharacterized SAM-binding protein YcdF (DUF218 family)